MTPPKYARRVFREGISDAGSTPAASTMRERPGFDGMRELKMRAGTDAHRNENQTTTAAPFELPVAA
jgi:hypothetical protein